MAYSAVVTTVLLLCVLISIQIQTSTYIEFVNSFHFQT